MSADTEAAWAALSIPTRGLSALLHPDSREVWLAIDDRGRRHLLVDASGANPGHVLVSTHGLRAETTEISVESGPLRVWADIACVDSSLNQTFVAVAEDLVANVTVAQTPLEAVKRTLRTWRWFWGIDPSQMSDAAMLGLFGEMWFLDRWAPLPAAVNAWHGPAGLRHDFSSAAVSVEVKATSAGAAGAPRHRIATLDQLDDPESGELYLFSVHAIPEPSAGNTLAAVVQRVRSRVASDPGLLDLLDRRLALAGWSPAINTHQQVGYRVAAERLYVISDEFPRLTRNSFVPGPPPGIDDVSYTVDLAVCAEWLIATAPEDASERLRGLT
ncbi:MAG: PD-(D/E)XK motif protein [Actinomycetales bacterium]